VMESIVSVEGHGDPPLQPIKVAATRIDRRSIASIFVLMIDLV